MQKNVLNTWTLPIRFFFENGKEEFIHKRGDFAKVCRVEKSRSCMTDYLVIYSFLIKILNKDGYSRYY